MIYSHLQQFSSLFLKHFLQFNNLEVLDLKFIVQSVNYLFLLLHGKAHLILDHFEVVLVLVLVVVVLVVVVLDVVVFVVVVVTVVASSVTMKIEKLSWLVFMELLV